MDKGSYTSDDLESLAKLLANLHSIPLERYNEFTGRNATAETILKQIYLDDFRKWSRKPYREYLELTDSPSEIVKRLYQKQRELVNSIPEIRVERTVTHGDLGPNCRRDGEQIYLIDWEFSRAGYPGNEILYFFEHGKLDTSQQKIFLEEYRKHRELGEAFEESREIYGKFLAFNDMIWAAKRVEKGEEKHRDLFNSRLERLEKLYSD